MSGEEQMGYDHEKQGTAYDPHAAGHERQGRASDPLRLSVEQATEGEVGAFVCPRCGTDCRPNGDPHLGTCAGPPVRSAPPPHKMMG